MAITTEDIKKLRETSGAGMMDCKAALTEANGNIDEAITILRKRGLAKAAKKAGRLASEGLVDAYIHLGGRLGGGGLPRERQPASEHESEGTDEHTA